MSAPPYMPLYIADYLADTTHLTRGEHGAYMLLMMSMWRAGGRLPSDDAKLALLAKCSSEEWAEIRTTILSFFKRRGGHLTHKRMTLELSRYENRIVRSRKGGLSSASKKAKENNDVSSNLVEAKTNQPEPEPEPEPVREDKTDAADRRASADVWQERLKQVSEAAGDALNRTVGATHHIADLRALVEPATGEPCSWDDVMAAVVIVAASCRRSGKQIRSWTWLRDDAVALRDRRLAGLPPVADVIHHPSSGFGKSSNLAEAEAITRQRLAARGA